MTFNYRRLKAERIARKISQDEMADKLDEALVLSPSRKWANRYWG
ncbi:hypothetical protein [Limosilactobacillus equigenerosi]